MFQRINNSESNTKKSKTTADGSNNFDKDDSNSSITGKGISSSGVYNSTASSTLTSSSSSHPQQTAIDITAADLVGKLSIGNVVDLVLVSMFLLPEKMPASFQATYTPIVAAGTLAQIEHLVRLLGTQLTAAGSGKGYELMKSQQQVKPPTDVDIKSSLPSSSGNELGDIPSTSAGITTMSTIPSLQQKK
ncbi:unnamed protein product [Adineta steineri]|uniref:Uncharacterized protein n=1 Tax=Adineta steineri TaxID=433720 RepID=A0A815A8I7_9BILA|nr:unnamed protein product [Adineta steineri]CAF1585706.1 unnamed protein product [Adineta steineri]